MTAAVEGCTAGSYGGVPPGDARPLSAWEYRGACAAEAMRLLAAPRRPGGSAASVLEYRDRWGRHAALARWERARDLDELVRLSSYGDRIIAALIDFKPYALPAPSFFGWRADLISEIVARHTVLDEPVIEVGCGLGKNLAALARHGFSNIAGFDVVPAAVDAVRDQAARFDLPVTVGKWDLRDPSPPPNAAEGATVLTNYVFEQFGDGLESAVMAIGSLRPRQVLCIEPSTLRPGGHPLRLERAVSALHARWRRYHLDIVGELRALQQRRLLRIHEVAPLGFSPHLTHSPALVRWSHE